MVPLTEPLQAAGIQARFQKMSPFHHLKMIHGHDQLPASTARTDSLTHIDAHSRCGKSRSRLQRVSKRSQNLLRVDEGAGGDVPGQQKTKITSQTQEKTHKYVRKPSALPILRGHTLRCLRDDTHKIAEKGRIIERVQHTTGKTPQTRTQLRRPITVGGRAARYSTSSPSVQMMVTGLGVRAISPLSLARGQAPHTPTRRRRADAIRKFRFRHDRGAPRVGLLSFSLSN